MSGKAARIVLSEKLLQVLEAIVASTTSGKSVAQRAELILRGYRGQLNTTIAAEVGLSRHHVGIWRRRWRDSFVALVAIEAESSLAELRRQVVRVLSDAPRAGTRAKFSAEQCLEIVAIAIERPEDSGRPVAQWTARELADEAARRCIVPSISPSHVARLLAKADLQPHRQKYWLNIKETDEAKYRERVEAVCKAYLDAPRLQSRQGVRTVCLDEMPGIQALQRIAPDIPMRSGQPARLEYEYLRHGTLCLIGSWDVVAGRMIASTVQETRTEEDLVAHIRAMVDADPTAKWNIVLDNLNTHASETLVRYVARIERIDESLLGVKGKRGILQSVATRQEFLEDLHHQIRFTYLPKHSSWLNQIEIIFGIIRRRGLRHVSFDSLDSLRGRLLGFIDYFNKTFAKPINWTYTGRRSDKHVARRPLTWAESWARRRQARQDFALVGGQL